MSTNAIVRWQVVFRLARTAIEHIDDLAAKEGFVQRDGSPNRSKMLRNMLAYATRHRPMGWRP